MESFVAPSGGNEPGLAALVERAWQNKTPAMTLEEVQRCGALDPVAYQIDTDTENGKPLSYSLDNRQDGEKISEIVSSLKVNDEDIKQLFGLRNADRDRALKLFTGGHIISDSVTVGRKVGR